MSLYESEKYWCTQATLKETLQRYGVAIIPSLLNEQECEAMIEGIWKLLVHITQSWPVPISQSNRASWKEIHKLHLLRGSMIQQYSNGHSQYMWDIRQNPKIVDIFASFWDVSPEDLLASFDGSTFSIPNNHNTQEGSKRHNRKVDEAKAPWYHLDQSLTRPEFETVQSWVNAYETRDDDATLALLEGSHNYFTAFGEHTAAKSVGDWRVLNEEDMEYYKSLGCEEKRIRCPRGSLVMWDSRTVHYGSPSLRAPADQTFRLVAYVCYRPRYFISDTMLQAKLKALQELDTTSHHPTNVKVFRKLPPNATLVHNVTPIEPPVLSELGKRLAGL